MHKLVIIITVFFVSDGCRNSQKPSQPERPASTQFYPIASFVAAELKTIDSLKLPVMKIITMNGRSDSVAATLAELKDSSQQLLHPDITASPLKEQYAESSFADQSIPSITLSYAPLDKKLAVQRLDVILQPDPVQSDKVQSIYLEKADTLGGTAMRKKMLWKAGKNFQIISDRDSSARIVKFEWNPSN